MIRTKANLVYYLAEDKRSLGMSQRKRPRLIGDDIWKFQIVLRRYEYYTNCEPSVWATIMRIAYRFIHYKKGQRLGFTIPVNVFGPGLRINHHGLLIVNSEATVGANCDIHQGVTIGQNFHKGDVPCIGDNVWIGPGAKLFGRIYIPNGTVIGANAVVGKSVSEENTTIAGCPARTIKTTGTNEVETAATLR
jgi:serine O-acetyltransferase